MPSCIAVIDLYFNVPYFTVTMSIADALNRLEETVARMERALDLRERKNRDAQTLAATELQDCQSRSRELQGEAQQISARLDAAIERLRQVLEA